MADKLQSQWQGQSSDLITELAWSPDGSSWAASSAAGEIVWMNLQEQPRGAVQLQAASGESIDSISFSADGGWLAASGQSGSVYLWDCAGTIPQFSQTIEVQTWTSKLIWHPTLPQLAIAYNNQIDQWDPATAQLLSTWSAKYAIGDLAWHPIGEYLAIASNKGVEIRSNSEALPHQRLSLDTASLHIAWSPDGRYLAAGNFDRSLTILDLQQPTDPWTLQGCPGKIRKLDWLGTDAQPCLLVPTGAAIVQWSLKGSEWAGQLLEGHEGTVTTVVACGDRQIFVSAATDNYACLWSAAGETLQIIPSQIGEFTALAWHPAGLWLLTGTRTGAIELWHCSA